MATDTKIEIGYSPLTEKIYLGKKSIKKMMWIGEKKDITDDFIHIMSEFVSENTQRTIKTPIEESENIFMNVKKDRKSMEKAANWLNKQLSMLNN